MIATETLEEYSERARVEALEFLRSLRSAQLRRMASPLLRAAAVGEIGQHSYAAIDVIDQVLLAREQQEQAAA